MAYDSDIVGWATVKGRRIPIRKGKGNAKGEFGNTGVVGFSKKNRSDKLKRPVNISKKSYESSVKKAKEQKAKALEERRLDKTSIMNQAYTRRERAKAEARKYQASGQLSKDLQESIKNLDDKWAKHTKKR